MTYKNTKTILFASLIVAMVLPFSNMNMVQATNNEQPRLLTSQDVDELLPRYLELEQTRQSLRDSSSVVDNSAQLSVVESELTNIMQRVQEHKEAAKIINYIPKDKLLKMKLAVSEIARSDISAVTLVGVDTKMKKVLVWVDGEKSLEYYKQQIEDLLTVQVPIHMDRGPRATPFSCDTQQSDCDPIVAGIEIENANGLCTLALEVNENFWPYSDKGWLTAGHCYPLGGQVQQPDDGGVIGTVQLQNYGGDNGCDCEFIKKTTTTTSESSMWIASDTYLTITSKGDASIDDWVLTSLSNTGGYDWGQVTHTGIAFTDANGKALENITIVHSITAQPGDSGAPIMKLFTNQFSGVLNGGFDGYDYVYYSPWSNIQSSLGVS